MNMHPKEKELQQLRTNKAALKNYIGPGGKLGTIAKYLGSVIMAQSSGAVDYRYMDLDPYDVDPEKVHDLPIYDESNSGDVEDRIRGLVFDGLSRGMHIEIKYLRFSADLTVYYKGYLVYREVAGDLHCYNPFPEWEDMIEKLYTVAHKKQAEQKKIATEEMIEEAEAQKIGFLQALRLRWGL